MGNPRNYSLELPERCLALIDGLWDGVLGVEGHTERYGGPLTTTFLLAMATPMILLPMERILKLGAEEGHADDRKLDEDVSNRVRKVFDSRALFRDARFFSPEDGWAYAFRTDRFNIARGLPFDLTQALNQPAAFKTAQDLTTEVALKCVRNALAHGVVGFLDDDGNSTYGQISTMLAFVGEKRLGGNYAGSHVLRISETGFRSFLRRWVKWLNDSGVAEAMAA